MFPPSIQSLVFPLRGGVGNQLFTITAALALNAELGGKHPIAFDDSWFREAERLGHEKFRPELLSVLDYPVVADPVEPRSRLQRAFGLNKQSMMSESGTLKCGLGYEMNYKQPGMGKIRVESLYLDGDTIFQPPGQSYLNDLVDSIDLNEAYLALADTLNGLGSFYTIHVRRGDYLTLASYSVAMDYYLRAIEIVEKLAPGSRLVVHSDDLDWCREQPEFASRDAIFIDIPDGDPMQELKVLSAAQCVITVNSTYSWWLSAWAKTRNPAYLKTIMPCRWFGGEENRLAGYFYRKDSICLK